MILNFDQRGAVSIEPENVTAAFECSEVMSEMADADSQDTASPARLVLEVQRNLGGMRMRAQIGGEFVNYSTGTRYEICVMSAPFDSGLSATCDSRLGSPLIPGMPRDFAAAAMGGLTRDSSAFPLPKGRLRVDRAGHDLMDSSEIAFEQAARLLRIALWATQNGADVERELNEAFDRLTL